MGRCSVTAAPLTVQFTDTSSYFESPVESWHWDFGDGGTSEETNPSHIYALPGAYTVSLTVASATGEDTETKSNYITVTGWSPHEWHSADTDRNGLIDLSELLRAIQFYNLAGCTARPAPKTAMPPSPATPSARTTTWIIPRRTGTSA